MSTNKRTSLIWLVSREDLVQMTRESSSLSEIARKVGYKRPYSFNGLVKKRLLEEGIDMSHIPMGLQSCNAKLAESRRQRARTKESCLQDILIEDSPFTRASIRGYVKRYDIIPYQCECGNTGTWRDKPITLELHHCNGNTKDNRPSNLRFVCPNCHAQEPTTNKRKTPCRPREADVLTAFPRAQSMRGLIQLIGMVDNGANYRIVKRILRERGLSYEPPKHSEKVEIKKKAIQLRTPKSKIQWPSPEELRAMVWEAPTKKLGVRLGVSDVAIAARCAQYGIEKPPRGYWRKLQVGMTPEEALVKKAPEPKRPPRFPPMLPKDLANMVRWKIEGLSAREIGRRVKRNHTSVARILRRIGHGDLVS